MAIHEEEVIEHSGMLKEIDEGAQAMLFDNLQRSQYQYPIKSTIRELVSNGIDAINERDNAIAILKGKAKESDFYYTEGNENLDESIQANRGVYKDSTFDPNYYNAEFLNKDANKVNIIYKEQGALERDLLIVSDKGVGLGGNRLLGYFKLGYSTKRLAKKPLGKFGLGAKVALSTGVKYYTTTSYYNGERFCFNVYSNHVESIIPPFNSLNGKANKKYVVARTKTKIDENGELIIVKYDDVYYSEETAELNGIDITVEVKKHNKTELINAVKNQLLYFPNISLAIHHYSGEEEIIVTEAEILYEDDKIVISDNNQFSKPHILINGISYGYIDFLELETEEQQGNIGIKVQPHEIEVSPSRESVIWNEITGATIKKRFKEVVEIATNYVSTQLVEEDFLKWLRLCSASLLGNGYNHGKSSDKQVRVMATLANIANLTELKPAYIGDSSIKFSASLETLFPMMTSIGVVTKENRYDKESNMSYKASRRSSKTLGDLGNLPIFIKYENTSYKKDLYLLSLYPEGFVTYMPFIPDKENPERPSLFNKEDDAPITLRKRKAEELFLASAGLLKYEEVDVPEGFGNVAVDEEIEEDAVVETQSGKISTSAKERRKLEGKMVGFTPSVWSGEESSWHKVEVTFDKLENLHDLEFYYGNQEYEELLRIAAIFITGHIDKLAAEDPNGPIPAMSWGDVSGKSWFNGSPFRLLKISKANERYMGDNHAHITSFFVRFNNGILTMSQLLVQWNTARIINAHLNLLQFMHGYKSIDADVYEKFNFLNAYSDLHYKKLESLLDQSEAAAEIVDHIDKVMVLQLFVAQFPDDAEAIAEKAKELFPDDDNAGNIKGAVGIDLELYKNLMGLLEYAKPISTMLNMVTSLTDARDLTLEQEQVIKAYVDERVDKN